MEEKDGNAPVTRNKEKRKGKECKGISTMARISRMEGKVTRFEYLAL